jgi:hypothetical protein
VTRAKISQYSATANDNTDVNGVNIAEGCPPSSMNNMGREIMAALKRFQVGSDGDGVTVGGALVVSGATTANTFSATNVTASGNLTFTGTGNRITGDFSNATLANRVMFQTSTVNGNTVITAMPNGTGNGANFQMRSYDVNLGSNGNFAQMLLNETAGTFAITTQAVGTGTALPMTFAVNGSERMRIDTSGNVGIGTGSPAKRLSVVNATDSTTVGANAVMTVQAGSSVNSVAEIGFAYGTWSGTNPLCSVGYQITSNAGVGSGALTFSTRSVTTDTAPTERMRIDSSGNLLVGTTSAPADNAAVNAKVFRATDSYVLGSHRNGTGALPHYYFFNTNGLCGKIETSGSSTTYVTSSDYRLKENIAPMTGALDKVVALKPCTYKWKADGSVGEGFIAHELQEVAPYAVSGEKDGEQMQGVDYGKITPLLTAALQEAIAEIKLLKTRVAELEAK